MNESLIPRIDRLLADPRLSPEQRREAQALKSKAERRGEFSFELQAKLDRMDGPSGATSARIEGTSLVLEYMTPEAAARRVVELAAEGFVGGPVPDVEAMVRRNRSR